MLIQTRTWQRPVSSTVVQSSPDCFPAIFSREETQTRLAIVSEPNTAEPVRAAPFQALRFATRASEGVPKGSNASMNGAESSEHRCSRTSSPNVGYDGYLGVVMGCAGASRPRTLAMVSEAS